MIRDNSIGFSFASAYRRSVPATTIFTCRPPHPNRQAGLRCRYRSSHDSPLEGTGFEPSVPLLRKALLNVANRRRGHERQSHFQVQVRDCNASLERLPIACPFAEGPRVRIRLPPAESLQTFGPSRVVRDHAWSPHKLFVDQKNGVTVATARNGKPRLGLSQRSRSQRGDGRPDPCPDPELTRARRRR